MSIKNLISTTKHWLTRTVFPIRREVIVNACAKSSNKFGGHNLIDKRTEIRNSEIGEYSYVSFDCRLIKCHIGKFCSIIQEFMPDLVHTPLNNGSLRILHFI